VVKKRGNSWWVVVYTGRDPLTGKKRQRPARPRPEPRPASSKPASSGKRGPLPAPTRAAGARASDRLPARTAHDRERRPRRACRPGRCLQAGPGVGLDRPQSDDAGHPAGGQAGQTSDHPRSARPSGGKITSLPGELRDEEWTKTRSKSAVWPSGPPWWSCCAPAGSSRPSRRSPAASVSRPTPMYSAARLTAPSRSDPTA
jgi:hypothetical protein